MDPVPGLDVIGGLHPFFFEALKIGKFADTNNNGYVSCLEAFLWAKEWLGPFSIDNTTYERSPQISGTELAENLYLIEKYP
jgi:hypothetical protein